MRNRDVAQSQCFRAQKLQGTILTREGLSGERGFEAGSDKQKLRKGQGCGKRGEARGEPVSTLWPVWETHKLGIGTGESLEVSGSRWGTGPG